MLLSFIVSTDRGATWSKPTSIDEDHIRLELEPEVSTIDFANGVRFDGFVIPALKTRRAKTGVELRDGQSFALAGLLVLRSDARALFDDLTSGAGLIAVLVSGFPAGERPIFNWLAYGLGVPTLSFAATAWLVREVLSGPRAERDALDAIR